MIIRKKCFEWQRCSELPLKPLEERLQTLGVGGVGEQRIEAIGACCRGIGITEIQRVAHAASFWP